MAYSRWATSDEVKERLSKISYDSDIKKSGIPMMFDENYLYIKDDEAHSLIIGSTGSGKTQSTILPNLRLAIKAEESFVLHDVKGELFEILYGELKKRDYNIIAINLDNPDVGNCFNPLTLPYKLYKADKADKAVELLERVGYYFCCNETINSNADPFWTNSAINLFVGLSLYLFENAKEEEINLNSIFNLALDFDKISEKIKNYDKKSLVYINLSNIVLAPNETKGSIVSVFVQNNRFFVSRESLMKKICFNDFDIETIQKEKTALFIITNNNMASKRLTPLIVEQCTSSAILNNYKDRRLNILIDEFENLVPIFDFNNMLTYSRGCNIRFNVCIRSLLELRNTYGNEKTEVLKMVFGNIIYLLANDYETLQEVSKLCGNVKTKDGFEPLISVEELKLLNNFEAVIIIPRLNPIKTKLIPDYKIKWDFNEEKPSLNKISTKEINTFDIN